MNRAAFLDRDGVINRKAREGEYVTRWSEVEILPGVAEAIARLNHAGFRVIVVSNQRCVAKGLISTTDLEDLHEKVRGVLAGGGATIDAIYYCPHEKVPVCRCRKPAPGMLMDAARDHEIDLKASWMIGDSEADIAAGQAAGCKTVLVTQCDDRTSKAQVYAVSLLDAVEQIVDAEEAGSTANVYAKQRMGI
jgi:D-glycero-D-manno-heptose 1,7-bisphosphate phosphatase